MLREGKIDKKLFLITIVIIISFASPVYTGNDHKQQEKGWVTLSVEDYISNDYYEVYKYISDSKHFSLIGKLMTVFLKDRGKGYIITPTGNKTFKIRSRKTVRPGSKIYIKSMDKDGFTMTGNLILKKIITFNTDVTIKVRYIVEDGRLKYIAHISYNAPAIVEGIDKTFRLFTGKNFVAYKLMAFVDRFHLVLEKLSELDSREWHKISSDKEFLSSLVFPVSFTREEIKRIDYVINSL